MKWLSPDTRTRVVPQHIATCMLLIALPLVGGCQRDSADVAPANSSSQAPSPSPGRQTTAAPPATPATPRSTAGEAPVVAQQPKRDLGLSAEDQQAEAFAPEVLLSSGHQATCHLQVGDTFPDLPLTTLDQQPASLATTLGQRLTIVVFWRGHQPMSMDQIGHLQEEFAQRYRAAGVAVVTINVGDPLDEVRALQGGMQHEVTCLSDPEGQAFAQVATDLLPRTYLLRSDRQVVWFDLEYSRSMRRELRNAILYVLRQFGQQANTGSPSLM